MATKSKSTTKKKISKKASRKSAKSAASRSPKNIIICCDGTNNQIEESPSNVYRLFRALVNDEVTQTVFYDPGVGTLAPPDLRSPIRRRLSLAFGLAFGVGLMKNLEEAYRFLMQTYEPGDRILLFGFSRGAYTVRGLAGLVRAVGILHREHENLIPYALRAFAKKEWKKIGQIGKNARIHRKDANIEFLGLWDTVSSYGFAWNRRTLIYTANNENVHAVRHAMAIDEKRAYFRQNRWGDKFADKQDVKEVWFPGVHSDIGGGYEEDISTGLSKNTLQWMVAELNEVAANRKFAINWDPKNVSHILQRKSDAGAPAHESLRGFWHVLEILPMNLTLNKLVFRIPKGRTRDLAKSGIPGKKRSVILHQSVLDRQKAYGDAYDPDNVPECPDGVEPWSEGCPQAFASAPAGPVYPEGQRIKEVASALLFVLFLIVVLLSTLTAAGLWLLDEGRWKYPVLFALPTAVLVIGGAILSGISKLERHAERVMEKWKKPLVHLRRGGYNLDDFKRQNDTLKRDGVHAFRTMLGWDFFFPFVYGPALFLTFLVADGLLGAGISCWYLGILPALVMVSDWIENYNLFVQSHPDNGEPSANAIKLASLATRVKFAAFTACAVLPPLAWIVVQLSHPFSRLCSAIANLIGG